MPARILIIDPVATNRILLKAGFASAQMQAVAADHEDHAIRLLRPFRPDLIVLDADLPGMRQGTLIQQIRSQPTGLDVPIIAIGTPRRPEKRLSLLRLGADEILPKPVETPVLLAHVQALLRQRDRHSTLGDRDLWAMTEAPETFQPVRWKLNFLSPDRNLLDRCVEGFGEYAPLSVRTCGQPGLHLAPDAVVIPADSPSARADLAAVLADPDRIGAAKIVLTAPNRPQDLRALERGADAVLPLSASDEELAFRITSAIRRKKEALKRQDHLRKGWQEALSDPLTKLPNRRHGLAHLAQVLSGSRPMGVALVDLDHFKAVNDRYGHGTGDAVLCHVGRVLQHLLGPEAMVARYGGEEFLLVFPAAEAAEAATTATRIAETLAATPHQGIPVTLSLGMVLIAPGTPPMTAEEALHKADQALYQSKAAGRNRATLAGALAQT